MVSLFPSSSWWSCRSLLQLPVYVCTALAHLRDILRLSWVLPRSYPCRPFLRCPSGWARKILGYTWERNAWSLRACLELVALPCASTRLLNRKIWARESGTRWNMDGPRIQGLFLRNRIVLTFLQHPSLVLPPKPLPTPALLEIIMHSKSSVLCPEFTQDIGLYSFKKKASETQKLWLLAESSHP